MKRLVVTFTITLPMAALENEGTSEAEARAYFDELGDNLIDEAPDGCAMTMHSEIVDT